MQYFGQVLCRCYRSMHYRAMEREGICVEESETLFCRLNKRIHHHHAIVVLAVVEVFAEELLAAGGFGGGEDGGVPVGGLETLLQCERGLENGDGVVLHAEALPFLDQPDGEIV